MLKQNQPKRYAKRASKEKIDEKICNKRLIEAIKLMGANRYVQLNVKGKVKIVNILQDEFVTLKCKHENAYLYGYYNKESREISQVRWMVEEKRRVLNNFKLINIGNIINSRRNFQFFKRCHWYR